MITIARKIINCRKCNAENLALVFSPRTSKWYTTNTVLLDGIRYADTRNWHICESKLATTTSLPTCGICNETITRHTLGDYWQHCREQLAKQGGAIAPSAPVATTFKRPSKATLRKPTPLALRYAEAKLADEKKTKASALCTKCFRLVEDCICGE